METTLTYYHLGSWTAVADAWGNIEQEFSYDAWGNSRDPYTWTGANTTHCMFDRGFTGHEMLYDFGLINMNGRCYDPVMSSFLSVDRYVQNPSNSQNFNRYAYCLNNPLKYTDPSGWQMIGGNMPKPFSWGFGSNVVYEPRDLGLRQLPEESIGICFPEDPEKSGGGPTDNASNAGPDDPPGGKNNQNAKQNNQNSQVNKDTQNVAEGAIYAGAGLTAVDGGLTVVGISAKSIARVTIRRVGVGGIIVSEYSDFNEFIQDPNLGKGTKLFVGVGLGVASVFCGPIIATAAFTLGVVNSCGGLDKLYDKLNR